MTEQAAQCKQHKKQIMHHKWQLFIDDVTFNDIMFEDTHATLLQNVAFVVRLYYVEMT